MTRNGSLRFADVGGMNSVLLINIRNKKTFHWNVNCPRSLTSNKNNFVTFYSLVQNFNSITIPFHVKCLYRLGTVNLNTVNSKFHLIQMF